MLYMSDRWSFPVKNGHLWPEYCSKTPYFSAIVMLWFTGSWSYYITIAYWFCIMHKVWAESNNIHTGGRQNREKRNRRRWRQVKPTAWHRDGQIWREGKRKLFLKAHRKSILLMWVIRSRLHRSRVSTLFPAIASLSRAQRRSTTPGTWGKSLKESPRLQSCERLPSSSGRESRRFPSKHSVCKLNITVYECTA